MGLRRLGLNVLERVLYPVTPVLVTARHDGRVGGMLAAWWMQSSFHPPTLSVAIAPERYTYKLIERSRVFAFNLLDFKFVNKMPYLGDVSERFLPDKIENAGFNIVEGEVLGAPIVAESSAAVELKLSKIVNAGDHDIFIGEAMAVYAIDDFRNGMWGLETYRPLMYLGRTRRPGPVYRVYLTPTGWKREKIEFARGELREYAEKRVNLIEKITEIVRKSASIGEAVEKAKSILREQGLEEDDAPYLVDDVVRRLKQGQCQG